MCSTSTFTCIKSMVSNCTIFINLSVLSLNIFWQMQQNFAFSCNSSSLFVNGTFFLISKSIISIACFLKDSQKKSGSFHTCIPHAYCLYHPMHILYTLENRIWICQPNIVEDHFSKLFLDQCIFLVKCSRTA